MQLRDCALKEVKEVLVGERLEIRANTARQTTLWDPREICRRDQMDRYDDAVAQLRAVGQKCIETWAQMYHPILHSLSGGFDSAVVLGCLSQAPAAASITCIHQFTAASCDDERRYARAAAQRAGVPLLELPMASGADRFDFRLLAAPNTPKPTVTALFRLLEIPLINRIAETTGARALWTGQGGDHIFLQTSDSSSAGDYLATRGIRPGFISALRDAARLSRQPYWFVLKSAWKRGGRSMRSSGLSRMTYFLNPRALPDNPDEYVSHPWTMDAEDLPKGKQYQLRFLSEVVNRHRPIPRLERAPQHHPLLSQPLMELCLQIPTYLLVRGGRERALARDAFADRVAPEILRRRDKGSIVSHATEMIRGSEQFVRELLLNGVLAGQGIIVPSELEPHLALNQPLREEHFLPLLACIAAEAWVRTCGSPAAAIAA